MSLFLNSLASGRLLAVVVFRHWWQCGSKHVVCFIQIVKIVFSDVRELPPSSRRCFLSISDKRDGQLLCTADKKVVPKRQRDYVTDKAGHEYVID